jgi:hypothetical protein
MRRYLFDTGSLTDYINKRSPTVDRARTAMFALGHCTVISKDSDLLAVPGLSVEDWSV